jgi:hypothetical protein
MHLSCYQDLLVGFILGNADQAPSGKAERAAGRHLVSWIVDARNMLRGATKAQRRQDGVSLHTVWWLNDDRAPFPGAEPSIRAPRGVGGGNGKISLPIVSYSTIGKAARSPVHSDRITRDEAPDGLIVSCHDALMRGSYVAARSAHRLAA